MKIVKRALSVCLIVVLASGLSMLTTAYVVNTYIQSVLASFDIKLDGPGPGIGGFVKSLTGIGGSGTASKENSKAASSGTKNSAKEADVSKVDGAKKDSSGGKSGNNQEKPMDETVPDNALPVMGQASAGEEQSEQGLDQNLVMTPEAMNDLKEKLPASEKSNIFNILMNKLPRRRWLRSPLLWRAA